MKVVIRGRLPGLNEYIAAERRNRHLAAKMKRDAQFLALIQIKNQVRRKLKTPIYMCYIWYERDRKRDKSNVSAYGRKVIEDAFVQCGAIPNDGWRDIAGFSDHFRVDKANPRIEIQIIEDYQEEG